mmetsp:Transcript_11952/g.35449  ORF Transcript_11952/g.35449 Transcript_11952/m.35449 type:complete len:220 (+) Transcript_11952:184-843(+)
MSFSQERQQYATRNRRSNLVERGDWRRASRDVPRVHRAGFSGSARDDVDGVRDRNRQDQHQESGTTTPPRCTPGRLSQSMAVAWKTWSSRSSKSGKSTSQAGGRRPLTMTARSACGLANSSAHDLASTTTAPRARPGASSEAGSTPSEAAGAGRESVARSMSRRPMASAGQRPTRASHSADAPEPGAGAPASRARGARAACAESRCPSRTAREATSRPS